MTDLLWICKDSSSQSLSHSSRPAEAQIRHHVQAQSQARRLRTEPGEKAQEGSFGKIKFRGAGPARQNRKLAQALVNAAASQGTLPPAWPTCNLPGTSECRSLAFFRVRTAPQCSGYLDYEFWTCLVLQLAPHSRAITHSLAALAALHENAILTENCGTMADRRRPTLLHLGRQQTEKAVQAATSPCLTHLEALVTCLILFCCYGLGNGAGMYRLLKSGHMMLEECGSPGHGVHDPFIEVNIRPLFQRLDARVCAICNIVDSLKLSLQASRRQKTLIKLSPVLPIPTTFGSLLDARQSLASILNSWRETAITSMPPEDPTLGAKVYSRLDSWAQALQSSGFDDSHLPRVQLLLASALNAKVLVAACHAESEMIFDEFTADFDRILALIQSAFGISIHEESVPSSKLHNMQLRTTLGIDDGVIDILSLVGSRCRDPQIRRRALQMLREGGRLEGDRSAFVPGQIVEAIIELEEQGARRAGRAPKTCQDVLENDRRVLLEGFRYAADRGNSAFRGGGRVRLLFRNALKQSSVEEYHVSLGESDSPVCGSTTLPDAIFRPGYAAFLDQPESGTYYEVHTEEFTFPMPRV